MTAKPMAVTDEQLAQFAKKTRELQHRFEKGTVDRPATIQGLQALIEGSAVRAPAVHVGDPFDDFRKVKGLILLGPTEWEKAMTSRDRRNRNLLNLQPGWCPRPEIPWSLDQLKKLVELCRTPEWTTMPILYLALPDVEGRPASLVGQYSWWGVEHDNLGPGEVRNNVFWANWFVNENLDWKHERAVNMPTWLIGYEHPRWATNKTWQLQQKIAASEQYDMSIASAAQDALMLNLCLAARGKKLRATTYSRTQTVCDGYPLGVKSDGDGVDVSRDWIPEFACDDITASVQGMPRLLAA